MSTLKYYVFPSWKYQSKAYVCDRPFNILFEKKNSKIAWSDIDQKLGNEASLCLAHKNHLS